jgi:3-oxoacyl-[acyl-carrier protein] reductase
MSRFENQVAVVTGGAQGIGYAIAERLLGEGAAVWLWDMNDQALAEARARLESKVAGGVIGTAVVEITDHAAVEVAAAKTESAAGKIDVLVHSAGISGPTMPLADYPPAEWKRIIDIDLYGAFAVNQAVVKRMIGRRYGRIVNIASVAGKEGNPNASAYSAAKAGLIGMTKSLGKELAGLDIAVNVITPAAAKTRIFDQMAQEHIDYMLSKIPRGRFVLVEEIAALVCWLASKENSFTTGAVFDISGGRATY